MTNTYVLQQARRTRLLEQKKVRLAVNIVCRIGAVLAAVGFIGVWGGAEFGALMLGCRILLSAVMITVLAALIAGESATHVELPLDGGEEDE